MAVRESSGLKVRGLRLKKGGKRILDGVDLDVPAGDVLALTGPTGCGKTSLLHALAGLEDAARFDALDWMGASLLRMPAHRRPLALAMQRPGLWPHLRVREHLRLVGTDEDVGWAVRAMGLAALLESRPGQLSGGQQRLLCIGCALAAATPLVLLDEPSAGLDEGHREQLGQLLRETAAGAPNGQERALVFTTHHGEEALSWAQRSLALRDGRLEEEARPAAGAGASLSGAEGV